MNHKHHLMGMLLSAFGASAALAAQPVAQLKISETPYQTDEGYWIQSLDGAPVVSGFQPTQLFLYAAAFTGPDADERPTQDTLSPVVSAVNTSPFTTQTNKVNDNVYAVAALSGSHISAELPQGGLAMAYTASLISFQIQPRTSMTFRDAMQTSVLATAPDNVATPTTILHFVGPIDPALVSQGKALIDLDASGLLCPVCAVSDGAADYVGVGDTPEDYIDGRSIINKNQLSYTFLNETQKVQTRAVVILRAAVATNTWTTSIPESGTFALMGLGLVGLIGLQGRRPITRI